MERTFQLLAPILGGIAAFLLWSGNRDGAFVSAAAACVAFFLSIRFRVKTRNDQREDARED